MAKKSMIEKASAPLNSRHNNIRVANVAAALVLSTKNFIFVVSV